MTKKKYSWDKKWTIFKQELPHQQLPLSKKNWGHKRHSICSYQGKLKPAIANQLINIFVPQNGIVLDPFSGVGTIPFEAALNHKLAYGFDISVPAYYISSAKVGIIVEDEAFRYIERLNIFIQTNVCTEEELREVFKFGFNKCISEYFEPTTLKEIILARRFLRLSPPQSPSEMAVISSLLHILHGNRPYALSRRSHPITPYAPSGEFIYKNLIDKLIEKVSRVIDDSLPKNFIPGQIFMQDSTEVWPDEVNDLDAIITSPPFFDSTRFYSANWMRLWFCGWSEYDFKHQIGVYLEEKQKKNMNVYESIFMQANERLKQNGVCVFHLGKSSKCDMASELKKISKKWFKTIDLFDESVLHCESYGIKNIGTVTSHQYLVLVK